MAKKDKSKDEDLKKKKKKGTEAEKKAKGKKGKDSSPAPREVKGNEWDETQSGGGDFFKLPTGETECLIRVRSVISVGQVQFSFNNVKSDKATSGIALVLECWPFKIKKEKIKLTSDKPAIVHPVFKALKGNDKAGWCMMLKDLGCDNPAELEGIVGMGTIKTTEKGYMFLKKRIFKAGLAEKKACPKLTQKGYLIPNLNCMTVEALKELHPFSQVKDYLLEAVNYPGSDAQDCVEKIRKDKPDFAKFVPKDGDNKGKGNKKKGKKKTMSEDEEY